MATEVRRNDEAGRYEITVDRDVAGFAAFHPDGDVLVFPHTEIDERYSGQGLAKVLIGQALDDVRARGLTIVPTCEFVQGYLEKNPRYQDLIA
jgi:predicted GNAT family acetyltransferase